MTMRIVTDDEIMEITDARIVYRDSASPRLYFHILGSKEERYFILPGDIWNKVGDKLYNEGKCRLSNKFGKYQVWDKEAWIKKQSEKEVEL